MTKYERLKDSERNRIIANFQAGHPEPDYEVISNKNQPGKFTVRRKVPITNIPNTQEYNNEHTQEGTSNDAIEERPMKVEKEEEEYNAFNDDELYMPRGFLSNYEMFSQMQMMMNKMFVEQFKVLRKDQKRTEKKRKLIGQKAKTIHDIIIKASQQVEKEREPEPEIERNNEGEDEITENMKEELIERPPIEGPVIENPEAQPYDEQLNNMRLPQKIYSRRNNLKTFI
jgi:hypothetical protein